MIDKEYLHEHAELRIELKEEAQRFSNRAYLKSNIIDGMPYGKGGNKDKVGKIAVEETEDCSSLDELKEIIMIQQRKIENVVIKLPKAKQKTVIRLRYYDLYSWEDIALFFFGDDPNFNNDIDYYKQKALKIHGSAILNLKKIQEAEETDAN